MIEAIELTKQYGKITAISQFSCKIENPAIVALLGANGAGKSTLMKILGCVLSPTSGQAFIGGYDILREPLKARHLFGYLPETPCVYSDMKVNAYLHYMGILKGIARNRIHARIQCIMQDYALTEVEKQKISGLSRGYLQRLGLAQAMISDPPILIIDEPTAGLDPVQIIETRQLLSRLGKNKIILISTHILSEVEQLCNTVIVLHQGHVVLMGQLSQLLSQSDLILELGNTPSTWEYLHNIPGVNSIHFLKKNTLCFKVDNGCDPRVDIGYLCAKYGWPILKMDYRRQNLEDLYIQVTKTEKVV